MSGNNNITINQNGNGSGSDSDKNPNVREQIRTQEAIRENARARGDSALANSAIDNIRDIRGASSRDMADLREHARERGDSALADTALEKMNESSRKGR